MFDFNTAVQTALSPAVTLPVIAVLAIAVAVQTRRIKTRLREQSIRLGKMTGALLAAVTAGLKSESEREVGRAIDFTYNTLKDIGFDKLAKGNVTFEDVMFGGEVRPFSMDELMNALGSKAEAVHPKDTLFVDSHGGVHDFEESRKDANAEGAGLGGRGPRPYHEATDFDARNPRAG